MTIQLNTDKNFKVQEAFDIKLDDLLSEELSNFSEHITSLEVHLFNEIGSQEGINDKRCLLEARIEGRQPIVVTGLANTYELAVKNAIDKLNTLLDIIVGRIRSHQRGLIT